MAKPLPDPSLPWPILMVGVALCADKESLRLVSYKCLAGKWTNGWGETAGVGPGMRWTKAYADQRFCDSLTNFSNQVRALCTGPTSEHEHAALVVLAYNIGVPTLAKSTVLRLHNAGDKAGAARAFGLFNKFRNPATGKLEVSNGLTIRRRQESAIYVTPDDDAAPIDMPQEVAPESSLAASPINQAGAATFATGALGLLSQVGEIASPTSEAVTQAQAAASTVTTFIGLTPLQLVCGVILVAGGVAMYYRHKQREEGWC